jgi:Ca2+:H+ antiporter
MYPLVKASITGSIVGNILLVLGMATLLGGLAHERLIFNRTYAGMGATLLALASIGLLVPSFHSFLLAVQKGQEERLVRSLSLEIAVILAVIYVLSLVFSLWSGRRISAGPHAELPTIGEHHRPEWNWRCSFALLLIATAGVVAMSELLAGSVEDVAHTLGWNQLFMGVIVVSILGNAAEQSTAVLMAMKNKMDLTMHIAIGSAIQMALFVAPVLIFASMLMGHSAPLDLHFTLLEMVTMILAVGVLALVSQDGESNWMEGVLLLGVYLILALAFYHLPGTAE